MLHFDNKWKTDRNQATDEPDEIELLGQLPVNVQNKIFLEFLFFRFWSTFRTSFFKIPKNYVRYQFLGIKYKEFYSLED